jgi:hypothetical protein
MIVTKMQEIVSYDELRISTDEYYENCLMNKIRPLLLYELNDYQQDLP